MGYFGLWDVSKCNANIDLESASMMGCVILEVFLLAADNHAAKNLSGERLCNMRGQLDIPVLSDGSDEWSHIRDLDMS